MVMYYKGCHIGYRPFYNSVICMYKMAFVKLLLGTRILLLLLFFFFFNTPLVCFRITYFQFARDLTIR